MSPLQGEYHNAKACTFDGRDCWVACLVDSRGELPLEILKFDCVSEHPTEEEARAWLTEELTHRGFPVLIRRTGR